jgi:hypothetical protein
MAQRDTNIALNLTGDGDPAVHITEEDGREATDDRRH